MPNHEGSKHEPKNPALQRLGLALRDLRKARGLSQRELAGERFSDGHLSQVENGLTTPSTVVLEHYAERCGGNYAHLELLLREALASKEQQRRERRNVRDPKRLEDALEAAERDELPDPSRLYSVVESNFRFLHDERGVGTEVRLVMDIRAKVAGMDRYYTGFGYNGDHRRGVVTPEPSFGCTLGEFTESDTGIVNGYFKLGHKLSPDDPEPYRLSFRMRLSSDVRAVPPCVGQFKTNARRHMVQLQFTPPTLPERVWWFDVPTVLEMEAAQPAANYFTSDPTGFYFKEFVSPIAGRLYGLDYRWEL